MASLPSLSLLPLKNLCSCSGSVVLAVLEHGTSISLYSHSFDLKFGTNTPWYVTPSPLQISFLVSDFISEYLVVLGVVLMRLDACVEIYFQVLMQVYALGK